MAEHSMNEERKANRHEIFQWVVVTAVALLVMLIGLTSYMGWRRIDNLDNTAHTLAQQVIDLGAVPRVVPSGMSGPRGADGRDGKDGRDGRDGQSPACLTEPGRCVGPTGLPGIHGTSGSDGTNGISPPCLTAPGQCRGADGRDGDPCPEGWERNTGSAQAPPREDGGDGGGWDRALVCVDPQSYRPPSVSSSSTVTTTPTGVSAIVRGP